MSALVFVGPEALRRHLVQSVVPAGVPVVDCESDPGALRDLLAAGGGLFGASHVHARRLDSLSASDLSTVGALLAESALDVVAEADQFTAAQERAFAPAVVRRLGAKGKAAAAYQEVAALLGTSLSAPDAARLEALADGNHGSAVGVLEVVSAAGRPRVSRADIERLVVNVEAPGLPWVLVDALERGDASRAVAELGRSDAIPAIAFAARRWVAASLAAEGVGRDAAAGLLGGSLTDAAWSAAGRLAQRVDPAVRVRVVSALADADVRAKSGYPDEALALLAAAVEGAFRS